MRGYTLDDGAFDTVVISRNELRLPTFPGLGLPRKLSDVLSPYAFFDTGYGKDRGTKHEADPMSSGAGLDNQLGAHVAASIDFAHAFRSGGRTWINDNRLDSRVTLTF